ncbi:serine/threonine-protein kinase [Xanthomonadaceae bacterium XH05]|nr:serine/threonine-protein kinase [Xanthomonadaceae bacterium XH05]
MLNPDDWARLDDLFHRACTLPAPERIAFAHAQADDHPELLRELLKMLDAEAAATEAVRKPLRELGTSLPADPEILPPGTRFGPWQVGHLIGKGGMGQVYLGHRADGAYDMKVAIKVIGIHTGDRERRHYFEFERQMLAHMQHPAIAQIMDAGNDDRGRLYLVMEYIEGQSLTRWCSEHKLSLRERVKLLIRVTEGVQHAHQKGVIHRDLKPGNILIGDTGGEPMPKIIDFGIAARTGAGHQMLAAGTPGYMSPEQITASSDIDSRSDVYSLGAILYELVSGKRPRGSRASGDSSSDPLRPSDELATLSPEEMSDLAARLRTPPQRLRRVLRHDLDWIVARATQPDRNLRYPSAVSFAEDLKRWLDGYPPQAAPHRRLRALRKFVRRNRLAVAACAAFAAAMLGGLVVTSWALHRAEQAMLREKASHRFLSDVLTSADPSVSFELDQTLMRRVLDRASDRIRTDLTEHPQAQVEIETTLAQTYFNLGDQKRALAHLETALETARAHLSPDSLETQQAVMELGHHLTNGGDLKRAETLMRDNLPYARKLSRIAPELAPRMQSRLGWNLYNQGRDKEALPLLQEAYETLLARVGADHQRALDAGQYYAIVLGESGQREPAIALMQDLVQRQVRVLGEDHPQTLALRNSLAGLHAANKDLASAEAEQRTILAVLSRQHGTGSRMLPILQFNLAVTLHQSGDPEKLEEAGPLFEAALHVITEKTGPDAPNTITMRRRHALWLADTGQTEAARDLLELTLASAHRAFGENHPATAQLLEALARQELALGNIDQAGQHAEAALRVLETLEGNQEQPTRAMRELLAKIAETRSRP